MVGLRTPEIDRTPSDPPSETSNGSNRMVLLEVTVCPGR
jgi:hypothetical protein